MSSMPVRLAHKLHLRVRMRIARTTAGSCKAEVQRDISAIFLCRCQLVQDITAMFTCQLCSSQIKYSVLQHFLLTTDVHDQAEQCVAPHASRISLKCASVSRLRAVCKLKLCLWRCLLLGHVGVTESALCQLA